MKKEIKQRIIEGRNFNPVRLIRIVKDMSLDEYSTYFETTKSYINQVEIGKRNINESRLVIGLDKLGINIEDYKYFESIIDNLLDFDIDVETKYAIALGRAIKVVNPDLKEKVGSDIHVPTLKKKKFINKNTNDKGNYKTLK
ncbi:MAG: hypothetical protein K6C11_00330 [Bacilli bacterium]|nr:hypothetical protein [Bacilli bacterium]